MSARVKKKARQPAPAKLPARNDGTYTRRARRPAREPAPTLRERRAIDRAERLADRGLPPDTRAASYAAARPSTFRRTRLDLGGEADAHTRNEVEFWRLREISRAMDRDDMIPGPLVDASLDLCLGGGIQADPDTEFPELDRAIKQDIAAWGGDRRACDLAGKHTLPIMERLTLRHAAFDGDKLVILHREGEHAGKLQLIEGQRLAGCDGPNGNILHGVEVDPETGATVAYHVLRRQPAERKQTGYRAPALTKPGAYTRIPAYDEEGRPNALLVMDPKRSSENRAVTTWHRVFDALGMTEDTLYATVQGLQSAACIPMAIKSERRVKLGRAEEGDPDDDEDDGDEAPSTEELTPGLVPRLLPGEEITSGPAAGQGPNGMAFLLLLFRLIAMQVRLPYSLGFRDTSNTVFHGYRGETEQAKRAAKWVHTWFPAQFTRPVYEFRLEFTLAKLREDPALAPLIAQAEQRGTISRVRIQTPAWPYVEPKTDREADAYGIERGLQSPRAVLADRGVDIDDMRRERHDDIAAERRAAKERAARENEPDEWRAYCATWALGLPLAGAPAPPAPKDKPTEQAPPDRAGTPAPTPKGEGSAPTKGGADAPAP